MRHKVVGDELSRADWESTDAHLVTGQATNDVLYFDGVLWTRTPAFSLMPGGAVVIASDAPASILATASILETRYGALVGVCGENNHQVQIQAAMNATKNVLLSPGTFKIASPLLPNAQNKLYGVSRKATILQAQTDAMQGVIQVNTDDVYLSHFGIDMNNLAYSGVRCSYTANIARCYIEWLYTYGSQLANVSAAIQYYNVNKGSVSNCYCDCTSGQGILASYGCYGVQITHNYIYHNYDNAIEVNGPHATDYPKHILVAHNIIEGLGSTMGRGIVYGENADYLTIAHNLIQGTTFGIDCDVSTAGRTVKHVKITGNKVWGSNNYDCRVYSTGAPTVDVTITDNEFMTSGKEYSVTGSHTRLKVERNTGYVTENHGTATLLNGQTSVVFAHGMSTTPTHVSVSWKENPTNVIADWWWTADGTNITVNGVDPGGSNLDFSWDAKA